MGFSEHTFNLIDPMPAFLFLMRHIGMRQNEAQKVVATKRLRVNGKPVANSGAIINGEVTVLLFTPQPKGLQPLFTTPDFAFFDKPSGVLVHPTTHRTPYSMLDEIRHIFGPEANAIHRIDMETSGLLLVSRNKTAEKRLKQLFEKREVAKSYLAWVRGEIGQPFEVRAPLLQNSDFSTIKLKMVVDPKGKPAHTRFFPICYDAAIDATLLRAIPLTGRQHQIRLHLFHVKHPILGDPIYGVPTAVAIDYLDKRIDPETRRYYMGADRLMLHAQTLAFHDQGVHFSLTSAYDFRQLSAMITPPKARYDPPCSA